MESPKVDLVGPRGCNRCMKADVLAVIWRVTIRSDDGPPAVGGVVADFRLCGVCTRAMAHDVRKIPGLGREFTGEVRDG